MGGFDLILWSRPKELSQLDTSTLVYELLRAIQSYTGEATIVYETDWMGSYFVPLEINIQDVCYLIERCIDRNVLRVRGRLVVQADLLMVGAGGQKLFISMDIGNYNPFFTNSFVVSFPDSFANLEEAAEGFERLFINLVQSFKPYYAFVPNSDDTLRFGGHWENDRPTSVHWMNYFDASTTEMIGRDKLHRFHGAVDVDGGVFLRLTDEPFDPREADHVMKRADANRYLKLPRS